MAVKNKQTIQQSNGFHFMDVRVRPRDNLMECESFAGGQSSLIVITEYAVKFVVAHLRPSLLTSSPLLRSRSGPSVRPLSS